MLERELKRYSAYFKGWCQAFGEHESIPDDKSGIRWLLAENQAGFILPQSLLKSLYREVLLPRETPTLTFGHHCVEVGALQFALEKGLEKTALAAIEHILESGNEFHIYLTSHIMYGTSTRIITLSGKKPISIIYKEIGTIHVRLDQA
jgi:hypothetical protein